MRVLLTSILVRTGILTHLWDLVEYLQAADIEVSVALFNNKKKSTRSAWNSYNNSLLGPIKKVPFCFYHNTTQLREFAQQQQAQLIHAHSSWTYKTAHAVGELLSLPLVLTLHGVENWQPFKAPLNYAKQIIAVGKAQANAVDSSHLNKISVISNGIDLDKFHSSKIQLETANPLKVIWFGRTGPLASEGARALDMAIGRLKAQGKKIKAIMVGENNIKTNHIKTFGWVENPVPVLQIGHIAFGHGRALREAMACGNVGFLLGYGYGGLIKPELFSISRNFPISAIPEYKLPLATPECIAKEIEELYDNRALLYSLRLQARKIAEDFFDVKEMVAKTISVYRSVYFN